ncbi:DUF6671 family protein [Rheinheimera baltica]|uniref:DUF6671 family protein n=1 Tax=Rheinheimera baltica TaxID=67576 RepID=UPI000400C839|nr:DUF6671 family protein [Rheinheimera baltica]
MTQHVALLTQHHKAGFIAPAMQELDWQISTIACFDTDLLGSFAGEHARFMAPHECAFRKAALAADLSGLAIGLGSEGSYSAGPYGLGTVNLELLCCINVEQGWAVTGRYYAPSRAQQWHIASEEALQQAIAQVCPGQHVLIQQEDEFAKGLTPTQALRLAPAMLKQGPLELRYDLRAHLSSERQQHILLAAEDLVRRMNSTCPKCHTPGFVPDITIPGLPCEACGAATRLILQHQAVCQRCEYQQLYPAKQPFANPQYCPECNP